MIYLKQNLGIYTNILVSLIYTGWQLPIFYHKKWEGAVIREGAFIRINTVFKPYLLLEENSCYSFFLIAAKLGIGNMLFLICLYMG